MVVAGMGLAVGSKMWRGMGGKRPWVRRQGWVEI